MSSLDYSEEYKRFCLCTEIMALINSITVLNDYYNIDSQNPSGVWDAAKYGKRELVKHSSPYTLAKGVLPVGAQLEFPEQSNVNLVVGRNGVGKTTVLKAIARSAANAMYFGQQGRSSMFKGNFAASWETELVAGTGGLAKRDSGRTFEDYAFTVNRTWVNSAKFDFAKASYDEQMFHFYLSCESFFMPNIMNIYHQRDDATIQARLLGYFYRGYEKGTQLPVLFERFISYQSERLGIAQREVKERLLYVMEAGGLALQTDCAANVFGEYDLGAAFPRNGLSIGVFDSALQTNMTSKGEYAKKSLESLLRKETPRLLLLDEPTSHLGGASESWFYNDFLENVKADPATMVFISTNDRKLRNYKGATVIDMDTKPAVVRINA